MEIASRAALLSALPAQFFIAFGPCKAGASDIIIQQLYLTTLRLSLFRKHDYQVLNAS